MATEFKVVEVKGGLCTGTLVPSQLQEVIDTMKSEGWAFKNCQDVMGKRCGCVPYQVLWAVFEK
ncbi:MAG: hypothetical protein JEY99_05780 [Spirochaetales bacterium]|nr:hypothetical protein [Spirochaetales bacterium]